MTPRDAWLLPGALTGTVIGILLGDAHRIASGGALLLTGAALVLALGVRRWPFLLLLSALLCGVALGAWRTADTRLPTGAGSIGTAADGMAHTVSGTLADDGRPRANQLQVVLDDVVLTDPHRPPRPLRGRLAAWLPRSLDARVGDRISLSARVELPHDFDGFAYREYLARQGIGAVVRTRVAVVVGHRSEPLADLLASVRRWLLNGLDAVVPEPEAALGAGILLGARTGIATDVSDAFAAAGLTHVVAISGWNIAILAALVAAALRPLETRPGGRVVSSSLTICAIGAYVVLTGASPSVLRAALMALTMLVARHGGSRAHAASTLMLACLLMLIAAPPVLWDVGFQLSALATAGLIWFGRPVEERLRHWPGLIREPIALTLAAQLTTLPVILVNFERLSLVAPLANVVVGPLVPLVMLTSAVAAAVGGLSTLIHVPLIGEIATWLAGGSAWLYLRAMVLAGMTAASVPFASLPISAPGWLAIAWYPGLALIARAITARRDARAVMEAAADGRMALKPTERAPAAQGPSLAARIASRAARPRWLASLTFGALLAVTLLTRPDGRLHVAALDVGQGDAILVRAPSGTKLLIDGGPDPDLVLRRLGEALPFFDRRIDVVVLSHPHEDHVAGLVSVLERFSVREVIDPGRGYPNPSYARMLQAARDEPGARILRARAGTVIQLDPQTRFRILYPTPADTTAPLPASDINNASVVGMLSFGTFRALLSGDAEAPVETALRERGMLEPVSVLKVGHHGSTSSSSPEFLAAVRPSVALISVGAGNDYGHPAPKTLAALRDAGARVHRTDQQGTVEVVTDGAAYTVTSQRAGTAGSPTRGALGPGSASARRPPTTRVSSACAAVQVPTGRRTGSIGACPSPTWPWPVRSSEASSCPTGWCATRRGFTGWRRRRRAWSARRASRWTGSSSRAPRSCTTSTSSKSATAPRSTACGERSCSSSSAIRSSPCRSPPTPSAASSTTIAFPVVGRPSWSRSRTATWPSAS